MWLLVVTAIAIAALVTSLLALSRFPKRIRQPTTYPPQYGPPQAYGPPRGAYPAGPAPYPPAPSPDPEAATWVPRSRCAELNITD